MELLNCFLFTRQYLLPSFEIGACLCTVCIWCYINYSESAQMQALTPFFAASFICTHIVVLIVTISSIILLLLSLICYICGSPQAENRKQNKSIFLLCELRLAQFHINKVGPERGNWEIHWLTEDVV